ncbi:serine/threonine-protein kinase [Kouleothrix sp.]|uniref:serine/threonine-protein kinase n=1 Tax=Kouleothrix sp. TaxID=2779161 RepID=UPI00391D1194
MEQPFASTPNEQRPYPDPLPPSFRLNGRYQVARMLASTNLSTVYRGIDLRTRVPVAIKRLSTQLRPGGLPRAEAQRAFVAEALLLKSIDHPQVPRMHDLIRDHGDYFMVLDYIGGQRLDALLEDEPLSRERAVAIARSLCAAAEALHRAGIVHADIKPNNVIVRPGDRVTLLDFGLARRVGQPAALDAAMGTPPYAPPEQWLSEPLDARSDVYALGHVLGELFDTVRCPELRQALAPALADAPAERFADVPALRRALAQSYAARHAAPEPLHPPDAWAVAAILALLATLAILLLH